MRSRVLAGVVAAAAAALASTAVPAPAKAAGPTAIGADSAGVVYVGFANGGQIKRYQGSDGAQLAPWGTAGSAPGQLGGVVAIDVAPGGAGNVWVLDTNRRVQEFSRTGQYLRGIQLNGCDSGVTPNPLGRGGLDVTNDDVYVAHPCADSLLRLRRSDLQTMSTGSLQGPKGVSAQLYTTAPEPARRIFIAQPTLGRVTPLQPWFSTDSPRAVGGRPADVFVDAFGVLFSTDTTNQQIHLYDSAHSEFRTLGSPGSAAGQLDNPTAIDVFEQFSDLAGNLFIADYANNRIQRWNPYGYTFWTAAADDSGGSGGPSAPVNSAAPSISGTAAVGSTVTCAPGTWSGSPSYSYQWNRDGAPIGGATGTGYTLVPADSGRAITCTVTATNASGSAQATSAAVTPSPGQTAPTVTTAPAVTGTPTPGNQLTCVAGTYAFGPYAQASKTVSWTRDDAATGVSGTTYTVTAADVGHVIRCSETVTSTGGGSTTSHSNGVTVTDTPCATGRVGVSINDGAQFTNSPNVTITAHEPAGSSAITISNDGGFGDVGAPVPTSCTDTYPHTLASSGAERLPKTVYVRFGGADTTFTDDIILDERAPDLRAATLSSTGRSLKLRASDAVSGVGRVQVARLKRGPFRTVRFARTVKVRSAKAARFVRVIDRAGNYSKWRKVRTR